MSHNAGAHPQGTGGSATHRQVFMGGAAKATWGRTAQPHGQKHDCAIECDTVRPSVWQSSTLAGVLWILWGSSSDAVWSSVTL